MLLFARGQLRRLQTTYAITNRRLTIETGILSRELHQTRLERVQNVNATQSLGERILHVGTVTSTPPARPSSTSRLPASRTPAAIVRTVDRALQRAARRADSRATPQRRATRSRRPQRRDGSRDPDGQIRR